MDGSRFELRWGEMLSKTVQTGPRAHPAACTGSLYIHTYIHTYILTYIHTYIHTYLHTYILTYLHTYIHTYLLTCIHTYLLTYILTYLPTYLLTYLHTYILTYIHTYILTYLLTYILIYLTAIGLTPTGGRTVHWVVRVVPRLCEFYPGICLTTREKARKNSSVRVAPRTSQAGTVHYKNSEQYNTHKKSSHTE
jgi:hypothetical protein